MLLPYDAKAVRDLDGDLDRWKPQLDYRGLLPRAWAGRLRRDLEAEAVAASTSMEGSLSQSKRSAESSLGRSRLRHGGRVQHWSSATAAPRSEERRVGEKGRSRGVPYH